MPTKYNIAICDDDFCFCEQLHNLLLQHFADNIQSIEDFANGNEMIQYVSSSHTRFDFILLDMQMPFMDGLTLAKHLRNIKAYSETPIIFITSYESAASEVVQIHPYEYIKKPIDGSNIISMFSSLIAKEEENNARLAVTSKGTYYNFKANDIIYICSYRRKIELHTVDDDVFEIYYALSKFYEEYLLDRKQFIQIGKSYILNLCHIKRVTSDTITLSNKAQIPLTRSYKRDFLEKYTSYFHTTKG